MDILDTPDCCLEVDTFDQHRWGIEPGLVRQLVHTQLVAVAGDQGQEGNFALGAGLGRLAVRLHRWRRAVSLLQPCANFLLPSCAASILFEFL